jgi:hypothetical protein
MANVLAPFGFRHVGYLEGSAPTMGVRPRKIALGNTTPIFRGDPVISLNTGYIAQISSNIVQVAGIFQGCEYVSVSQGRKVRSNYWPGSDAAYDVDAFVLDAQGSLWLAQSNGGAHGPIVIGDVDNNIGVFIATGGSATPTAGQGNTTSQLSGALLDTAGTNAGGTGAINTTSTLPFRIYRLYSDFVAQGSPAAGTTIANGADNTTNFNWAVVAANNWDTKSLTGI